MYITTTLADAEAMQAIQDNALDFPRPGWSYPALVQLPPGVSETAHYAAPEPDHARARWALRLAPLDPDELPAAVVARASPQARGLLIAALRARRPLPVDWSAVEAEPIEPGPIGPDVEPQGRS